MTGEAPPGKEKPDLGRVRHPPEILDHDLKIGESYPAFSTEILRLSLGGLAVVGFLFSQRFVPADGLVAAPGGSFRVLLGLAVTSLTLAAGFALLHRYLVTDVLANRLEVRHELGKSGNGSSAERPRTLKRLKFLLVAASMALWLGVLFLGTAFLLRIP